VTVEESNWIAVICVGAALIVALLVRWRSKRKILNQHEPMSLVSMYQQEGARIGVCYGSFEQVLNFIGQAYAIDPERLRPSDKLNKLYNLDTWELYTNTDKLSNWLEKSFGITSFDNEPETIAELMISIKQSEKVSTLGSE
jgi:hypothetical protein